MRLKPLLLYLPELPGRMAKGREYFQSQGITEILEVWGVHAKEYGITNAKPFIDEHQNKERAIIDKNIGCALSHYMIYNVANALDFTHYLILEDDARFIDGWREKLEQALKDVPPDFDVLFVGCCWYGGKPTEHIKGDVYEVKYPLCGHCYIVAKKAIPHFLKTQRNADLPVDMNLADRTFPDLKVYTILPRLSYQEGVCCDE